MQPSVCSEHVWAAGHGGTVVVAAAAWAAQHADRETRALKRQLAQHADAARAAASGASGITSESEKSDLTGFLGEATAMALEASSHAERMQLCLKVVVVLEALADETRTPQALCAALNKQAAHILAPPHLHRFTSTALITLLLHANQAFVLGAHLTYGLHARHSSCV
jgi:hypothetical protein